jgi:EmrB/QacA subfamily drug resistance transporter
LFKEKKQWLGMAALVPGLAMVFMDQTIIPVALPAIQREFSATNVGLEWSVNSYLLAMTMAALIGGKIGDRIGHRTAFLSGLILFTLSSILCSLSPSIGFLVFARALQGLGAAFMIPSQNALFAALFAPKERGRAIGLNTSISSLFMIVAPLIGGYLTVALSWRWIFWINLPFGILTILFAWLFLPKPAPTKAKIDGWGLGTFAVGIASLTIYFMNGRDWGFLSQTSMFFMVLSLLGLFFLFYREKKAAHPFLDLSLFKNPTYSAVCLTISILSFVLMVVVFRAIYFQTVLGYSPLMTGLITCVSASPILFISPVGGYLSDKFNPRLPIAIGFLFLIGSFFWLGFVSLPSLAVLFVSLGLFGIGMPLIFTPSFSHAMNVIPPQKLGIAFGMIATLRSLFSTMGVALIGLFIDLTTAMNLEPSLPAQESERLASAMSFSLTNFTIGFLLLITFALVFVLHRRKSLHQLPSSPAEGWD